MRDAFVSTLTELARGDETVVLVTGDLGFGIFDDFIAKCPNQFINVGVAEQNMIGVSTGMALEGYRMICYSIANFGTMRCLEQIRNDACYHGANVTVVSSGGGFTYGPLGMSHHATEDVAVMRALPGTQIVVPADAWESAEATKALVMSGGVSYLRIEKDTISTPRADGEVFRIGKARRVRDGRDLTLITMGGIIKEALEAARVLNSRHGIHCRVVSMHSVKPLDKEEICLAAQETGGIIVIEEHSRIGGLGGAVSELLMDQVFQPASPGRGRIRLVPRLKTGGRISL